MSQPSHYFIGVHVMILEFIYHFGFIERVERRPSESSTIMGII